jgi:hypothetical protein
VVGRAGEVKNLKGKYELFPDPGRAVGSSLALKPNGHLLLAGDFSERMEFPGITGTLALSAESPGYYFFVVEITPSGQCLWARRIGGAESTLPLHVAADSQGNCFVTGGFESLLKFDGVSPEAVLHGRGGWDFFVAQYDPKGALAWVRQGGGPKNDYGSRVHVDHTDCCYVTGRYGSEAYFGEGESVLPLACLNEADMFMACYANDGDLLGALRVGGSGPTIDSHWTIVFDEFGTRYLVGGAMRKIETWRARPSAQPLVRASTPAPAPGLASASASPVPPSRFETIARGPDGSIQILLQGHPNAIYVVEASVDLNAWVPVSTNRIVAGRIPIGDPRAADVPVRFYRVCQP